MQGGWQPEPEPEPEPCSAAVAVIATFTAPDCAGRHAALVALARRIVALPGAWRVTWVYIVQTFPTLPLPPGLPDRVQLQHWPAEARSVDAFLEHVAAQHPSVAFVAGTLATRVCLQAPRVPRPRPALRPGVFAAAGAHMWWVPVFTAEDEVATGRDFAHLAAACPRLAVTSVYLQHAAWLLRGVFIPDVLHAGATDAHMLAMLRGHDSPVPGSSLVLLCAPDADDHAEAWVAAAAAATAPSARLAVLRCGAALGFGSGFGSGLGPGQSCAVPPETTPERRAAMVQQCIRAWTWGRPGALRMVVVPPPHHRCSCAPDALGVRLPPTCEIVHFAEPTPEPTPAPRRPAGPRPTTAAAPARRWAAPL